MKTFTSRNDFESAMASAGYIRLHTASRRGYESRKTDGHAEEYAGKFGAGYIWVSPRYDTTQYVDVTYYVQAC